MRRRQQDHDNPQTKLRPRKHKHLLGEEDASLIIPHDRRRPRRLSIALAAAIVGVVLIVVFYSLTPQRPSISPQEDSSLRGTPSNVVEKHRRVIAVGDIHGDKDALVRALQLANVVDQNDGIAWTGNSDIVVQIGDLLNGAEPRDEETLSYIAEIERRAREAGGGVVVTVGDHDLRNAPALWRRIHSAENNENNNVPSFPSWIGAAHVVDRTLFVHGSLSKTVLDGAGGSLEAMVRDAWEWLSGGQKKPDWIGRGNGPIWSRLYSDKASDEQPRCDDLDSLLNYLSVDRMVVGHTVRREGISSICDGRAWRIDVGLSRTETRAGKIGASEVLELREGGSIVTVLSTDTKLKSWER